MYIIIDHDKLNPFTYFRRSKIELSSPISPTNFLVPPSFSSHQIYLHPYVSFPCTPAVGSK